MSSDNRVRNHPAVIAIVQFRMVAYGDLLAMGVPIPSHKEDRVLKANIKAICVREGLKEDFFVVGDVEEAGVYAQCTVEEIDVISLYDKQFVIVIMASPSGSKFSVLRPFNFVTQMDCLDATAIEEWDSRLATLRAEVDAAKASGQK